MSDAIVHVLREESWFDAVHTRRLLEALSGFVARSSATGALSLEPQFKPAEILAVFQDHELLTSRTSRRGETFVLRRDGYVLDVHLPGGRASFAVQSKALDAREVAAALLARLEPFRRRNSVAEGVWADFSHMVAGGVDRNTRFLRAPRWEEIRANYPVPSRDALDRLLGVEEPWKRGRLVIWHGMPGTGKTWAIRALMMHWRERFDFLVVTDPERFAKEPAYYQEVASEPAHRPPYAMRAPMPDEEGEAEEPHAPRRTLFVLEDSADLILQESRTTHYDKISKLLGMTDGLSGQGREDLFLLTFNEDVRDIDPAFLRPGRCIARVEFPRFGAEEASAWLAAHGVRGDAEGEMTLAEMYAKANGAEVEEERVAGKGFAAG